MVELLTDGYMMAKCFTRFQYPHLDPGLAWPEYRAAINPRGVMFSFSCFDRNRAWCLTITLLEIKSTNGLCFAALFQ